MALLAGSSDDANTGGQLLREGKPSPLGVESVAEPVAWVEGV